MAETVAIIDYGSGNLRSAAKSFERAATEAGLAMTIHVTDDPKVVAGADRVVLPGVGAFADCKRGLACGRRHARGAHAPTSTMPASRSLASASACS